MPGERSSEQAARSPGPGVAGYSLVEVLVVCLLVATAAGTALPTLTGVVADMRVLGAARLVAATLQRARVEAAARGTQVAVRVQVRDGRVGLTTVADGNRNGVRALDIARGADVPLGPSVGLDELFPGVSADGVLNATQLLSFSPLGTSSSGSVYLRGRAGRRYGVRVLGATGRTRLLRYREATGEWLDWQ